jgi:hypothetical protein
LDKLILNALVHGELCYAETWPEVLALINEVMQNLNAESHAPYYDPGEDAKLMFSSKRHTGEATDWPNNFLQIAVNTATGYGGLIWFVTEGYPEKGGIFDHVWVSNNPTPPDFDPRVVSDPGEPMFHDRRSALPIPRVREAVEEFCRIGTGARPERISWVRGYVNGHRLE